MRLGFAPSNRPHLHRAYEVTVCNQNFIAVCTYAICQQDVDMMLRAKVVVGLSYKLKSHIPKWGNELLLHSEL